MSRAEQSRAEQSINFTYEGYFELVLKLQEQGYKFVSYHNWKDAEKCVIFRHDIDNDVNKALVLARCERERGIFSTYFVLLTSDFYNVFSRSSAEALRGIADCGHEIGLHFDEMRYPELAGNVDAVRAKIQQEAKILEAAAGCPIRCVSMHRPSPLILEADLEIPGIVNSYGKTFFKEFKYLSDSRRRWREPVDEIIASGQYRRLHILTHAFWYQDRPMTMGETVKVFIEGANRDRWHILNENFTKLEEVYSAPDKWGRGQ